MAANMKRTVLYFVVLFLLSTMIYNWLVPCVNTPKSKMVPKEAVHYVYDAENKAYPYDRMMPLIFIGGVPRSGTTLMRAMLDAHPDVRCGEETRVIPRILGMRSQWGRSQTEAKRLKEAGVTDDVVDAAVGSFILEVIAKHGDPAPYLCNKDPFTLKSSVYLSQMFPNAKFILMIRDGRATVHSIISRKVTISGFDLKSFRKSLEKWNLAMETMYYQCLRVGIHKCMPVYYEQLVLHPELWIRKILEFLDITWNEAVLHHEDYIGKPGGVSLSKIERSTDQVIKPINLEALSKWVNAIPEDVKEDIAYIAPMLSKLGYDPHGYPPNYGDADKMVADNTLHIRNNEEYWRKKTQEIEHLTKPPKKVIQPGGQTPKSDATLAKTRNKVNSSNDGHNSSDEKYGNDHVSIGGGNLPILGNPDKIGGQGRPVPLPNKLKPFR